MTYRLKKIEYLRRDVFVLLQNENGPCPLLAASNCLLLKELVTLPPRAVRNGVTSLEDITNMLANYAMQSQQKQSSFSKTEDSLSSSSLNTDTQNQFSLNEFMNYIPNFQYGMDVNPKFTVGCQGYEYTAELSVLSDMLGCKLLHGWLIDPIQDEATAIAAGNKSYNELIDRAIVGNEAETEVSNLQIQIDEILMQYPHIDEEPVGPVDLLDDDQGEAALNIVRENLMKLRKQQSDKQDIAIATQLVENFLADSCHQLTTYGLEQLHATIHDREICIMFRNNHFSTIARHGDNLYLLVTDLGYANTSAIVWEKLDVVDGDTEFCDSYFICSPSMIALSMEQSGPTLSPEQMMASSTQNDVDYQLALQLSMQGINNNNEATDTAIPDGFNPERIHDNISPGTGTIVSLPSLAINKRVEVGLPVSNPMTLESRQEAADRMLALQLQQDHNPVRLASDEASLRLAQQLQEEENQREIAHEGGVRVVAPPPTVPRQPPPTAQRQPNPTNQGNSNCIIM